MHVLMLGWEFPPFITGGLGTACHGLTRALDQRGVRVTFVLPRGVVANESAHVQLVSPETAGGTPAGDPARGEADPTSGTASGGPSGRAPREAGAHATHADADDDASEFRHVRFISIDSPLVHPYQQTAGEGAVGEPHGRVTDAAGTHAAGARAGLADVDPTATERWVAADLGLDDLDAATGGPEYGGDLIGQVQHYARFCLRAVRGLDFDVIHAHDWMTYPAGLWIARATGRPLVVHVHSTEFDRSGERVNQRIYDIERRGMHGAVRVIAVSQLTKNVAVHRYGVPDEHVQVVYNGVELDTQRMGITGIRSRDKIVLYFGRITFQKGPEYFLRGAKRVLEVMDNVKFVVAGSGDMAQHMIEMAAGMGIGHQVLFTGFLRGDDIKRVFSLADLYVMPSVSEPFGIAPLEAMGHDVPVLISRSSGVSEVLTHALKVDFWDVDDIANKIVAVLRHPPLSQTLQHHAAMEVRRLTWDGAADRCEQIYHRVVDEMPRVDA